MRKLLLLDDSIIPANGILRSEDVHSVLEASKIIEQANAWSDQRRHQHEQQMAELRDVAVREAYQEGIAALLRGRDVYLGAAEQLSSSLDQLLRTSLQKILGAMPSAEVINTTLIPILESVRQEANLAISVHPDRVSDVRAALKKSGIAFDSLEILPRLELSDGDCIIYTESSVINVSIPVIIDQLIDALSGVIHKPVRIMVEADDE